VGAAANAAEEQARSTAPTKSLEAAGDGWVMGDPGRWEWVDQSRAIRERGNR
jgi:hypothetical protein